MNKSTRDEQRPPAGGNVLELAAAPSPGEVVAELLRNGAQALLVQALEAEIAAHVASYEALKDSQGRQRIVRNGHLPRRELQTGIGALQVQVPRARDRGVDAELAAQAAGSAHGPWHLANSPALALALPNAYFAKLGLPRLHVRQ